MAISGNSWANAESNVIAWISGVIEQTDIGRNLFIGELPPGIYNAIAFAINGPTGTDFIAECKSRNMSAVLIARYESRVELQEVEHQLRGALPVTTIDDVQRVAQTGESSIEREIIGEGTDNPIRVWTMTVPLMVAFNSIT